MPLYAEKYAEVANRFKEWLTDRDNTGDYVTDITLDYINRANQALWGTAFWDDLTAHVSLTMTGKVGVPPSDFGRTYCVYHDSDGDGKPDWYYYRNARVEHGYKWARAYAKDTGSTFSFTFFTTPNYTPVLVYQKVIADFAGSGDEYLFWPAELLLKTAQCLFKEDSDDLGVDYDKMNQRRVALLEDFKKHHQFVNNDLVMEQNDAEGGRVNNEGYDLANGGGGIFNPFDNSRDMGLGG